MGEEMDRVYRTFTGLEAVQYDEQFSDNNESNTNE